MTATRVGLALALVLVLGSTTAAQDANVPRLAALDFEAVFLNGQPYDGDVLAGKVVLLDFWAVWCPPCLRAFPKLNRIAATFPGGDVHVLGVTVFSGSRDEVSTFLSDYDVRFPVLVAADDVPYEYGVIGVPTYLLVGTDGSISKRYAGELPDLVERLTEDVQTLLEHRTVN